jgi:hypothetical protein
MNAPFFIHFPEIERVGRTMWATELKRKSRERNEGPGCGPERRGLAGKEEIDEEN